MAFDPNASVSANAIAWSTALDAIASAQEAEVAALTLLEQRVAALEADASNTPTPTPALTLTGPLSFAADAVAGMLVANIANVPSGVTPTISPNDGRLVVAGNAANGWKILVGMTAASAGTIALTVSADGARSASADVTVSASIATPTSGDLLTLGPVGINPDFLQTGYYGNGQPFLNRLKMSSEWQAKGGAAMTLDADGYPATLSGGTAEMLWNAEYTHGPAGVPQRYVLRTTLDWSFYTAASTVSDTGVHAGTLRRWVFDLAPGPFLYPVNHDSAFYAVLGVSSAPTPRKDGDILEIVRLDQEALLDAGEIFQPQFIDRNKRTGGNRFMDWDRANDRSDLAGFPTISASSWAFGTPFEVQAALCNKSQVPGWINIPLRSTDAEIVAAAQLMLSKLEPNVPLYVELSNEVWNPQFQQFGQSEYLFQPPIPNGYSSYINYGYRSAQVMALILKATNYDRRVKPYLGSQAGASFVLDQALAGVKAAISEWSDPQNTSGKQNLTNGTPNKGAVYDAELAARLSTPKAIYAAMGPAVYCDAGIGDPNASSSNIAIMQGWATAEGDEGLVSLFRQLYHGDLMPSGGFHLDNWGQFYAGDRAISAREGIPLVAYEGNVSPISLHTPEFAALWNRALHDSRMKQFIKDWITASLTTAGFTAMMVLADIAEPNSTFGLLESPYDFTTPRFAAVIEAQASLVGGAAPGSATPDNTYANSTKVRSNNSAFAPELQHIEQQLTAGGY